MRIAIVANTSWYISNFRLNLMRDLRSAGHSVLAVAPGDDYVANIREAGFEFEDTPISGRGVNPAVEFLTIMRLVRVFKQREVELVLSYTPKGNLYSALAAIFLNIFFVPNVSGLGSAFIKESMVTRVVKILYRVTFRRAFRVFFQNSDDLDIFLKNNFVRAESADRVPGSGVDLERFVPPNSKTSEAETVVFLLIARMLWDKGIGEYVDAARAVRDRYPNSRFQLVGSVGVGNPTAISRAQIDSWVSEGVVEYLGHTDDVRPWLAQADCIVLPSYREGVPRTLLEAGAMARPIVTTDAPGCRDTVVDGNTGFLCKPADSKDLAEKLFQMIEIGASAREEMGAAARRYVESRFDEKIVIERYHRVVEAVAIAAQKN